MLLYKTDVRPSQHGMGLFADEDISKGSVVWRCDKSTVVFLTDEQIETLKRSFEGGSGMARFIDNFAYKPKWKKTIYLELDNMRYINHCEQG